MPDPAPPPVLSLTCHDCARRKHAIQYMTHTGRPSVCLVCPICDAAERK